MQKLTRLVFSLFALGACSVPAYAQQPYSATSVRLVSESAAPANLTGRAGIYNKSGVFTWHSSSNVDGMILQCPSCTTNVLPYVSAAGVTSPSNFFYDSTDKQFCDASAGGTYCIRLNASLGVASIGYHIQFVDGNYVQSDTVGTKLYHNGSVLTQTLTAGGRETLRTTGAVESTLYGFVFPNATLQSTAANADVPNLIDGPTVNIDLDVSDGLAVTIAGNRTFTVSNFISGSAFRLQVIQGAGGSHTATWPAAFHWAGGVAPTLTTAAGQSDVITCKSFNGTTFMCTANANFTP